MNPTGRILLIGDTHGNEEWTGTCISHAKRLGIRTAIQLGDFGIWPHGNKFLATVSKCAVRKGVVLYAMTGNHDDQNQIEAFEQHPDDDGFITLRPNLRWIPRAHRWEWDGVRFGSLGGAFSIDWQDRTDGVNVWFDREEVQLADITKLGPAPLDVLLTHDVPDGVEPRSAANLDRINDRQARQSRLLLRQAVWDTKPILVVHGHWHQRQSRNLHLLSGDQRIVRVEGLASDQEHGRGSWGVLDLSDLSFRDGQAV